MSNKLLLTSALALASIFAALPAQATAYCDSCAEGKLGQCCDGSCACIAGLACDYKDTTAGACVDPSTIVDTGVRDTAPPPDIGPPPTGADTGTAPIDARADDSANADAPNADAANADAASADATSPDGGGSGATPSDDAAGGCGCHQGAHGPEVAGLASTLAAAVLAMLIRRRRTP